MSMFAERTLKRVAAALVWWLEGVWLGLPRLLRDRLFRPRTCLLARIEGADVVLQPSVVGVDCPSAAMRFELHGRDHASILEWFPRAVEADIILLLPPKNLLEKTLSFPLAAEPELRSVLYHELERLTPFRMDEFVYDYHVLSRNEAANRLLVSVALARRSTLDETASALEKLGIRPTAITSATDSGTPKPFNVLPVKQRFRLPFSTLPVRLPSLVAAAFAIGAALVVPPERYERLLEQHRFEAAVVRQAALAASIEIEQQRAALEGSEFINQRRRGYIPPIELLTELTTQLPDHTWLSRISIGRGTVQLQGESRTASGVLETIEASEFLEGAEFQSPVARASTTTGKEQFTIAAKLRDDRR
jgi:general secretion pathway protein L